MSGEFSISALIPATPEEIFEAWLNSGYHSRMTGSPAEISNEVGGSFQAWDGYIQGKNLILDFPRKIVQSWRTADFSPAEQDSRVEIVLQAEEEGTRVSIHHSHLPEGGETYKQGWVDNYFEPMKKYFGG